MSYEIERLKPILDSRFWVVIRARLLAFHGVISEPAIYQLEVDNVQSVRVNGVLRDKGEHWTFDPVTRQLTVTSHGASGTIFVVVSTDIYLSDAAGRFFSNPLDETSEEVEYLDRIEAPPPRKETFSDSLLGLLPAQSSSLRVVNDLPLLQKLIGAGSFKGSEVVVYHTAGLETVANTRIFLKGRVKEIEATEETIAFSILDSNSVFDQSLPLMTITDGGQADGSPVPLIIGQVEGVRPVVSNYLWFCATVQRYKDLAFSAPLISPLGVRYTSHPGSNTTTRTYYNTDPTANNTRFVQSYNPVGDWIILSSASATQPVTGRAFPSGTIKYSKITGYGQSGGFWYIDHEALDAAMPATSYVWIPPSVKRLYGVVDGIRYELVPWRDYLNTDGLVTVQPAASSNVGAPRAFTNTDQFSATVRSGLQRALDDQGQEFGFDNTLERGGTSNPIYNLAAVMVNILGIPAAEIDWASFEAARVAVLNRVVGRSFPETASATAPSAREMIGMILMSCLMRLRMNRDGKWELQQVAPVGTNYEHGADERQYLEAPEFEIRYADLWSEVVVEFARRDVSEIVGGLDGQASRIAITNPKAMYLHEAQSSRTFDTIFRRAEDALWLAQRLSWIFGERKIATRLSLPLNAIDPIPGEAVEVKSAFVPGAEIGDDLMHTIGGVITDLDQTDETIEMTVEDQRGVEDNADDW